MSIPRRDRAMSQPGTASLLKTAANVVAGYGPAVLVQLLVFPVFGLQPTLGQNLRIPPEALGTRALGMFGR